MPPDSVWQHFKGHRVVLLAVALNTDDLTFEVVYKHNDRCFVRPYEEWADEVDRPEIPYKGPRFVRVV
jgi:hypothetical protein